MENKFEDTSYVSHEGWYDKQYPDREARLKNIQTWKDGIKNNSINYWLHRRMFEMATPFIKERESWLTIGDGYGFDALYFKDKGCNVMATDIAGTFLPLAKAEGMISDYSVENVEKLTFADNSFDYSFCKESYHHFPRAYLGVYEMLRVTRNAVILIEPQDPLTKMPLMLAVKNILDRFNPNLLQKYWKNRYSFEPVGNYVFKLSDRDMEKLAMGMNLPAIAFKGLNGNNYYNPKTANQKADDSSTAFREIQSKIKKDNFISKLGILPYQTLCAVIFKTLPDADTITQMRNDGFLYYEFPKNPYL
jgi:SAM-dependent methyltransferase